MQEIWKIGVGRCGGARWLLQALLLFMFALGCTGEADVPSPGAVGGSSGSAATSQLMCQPGLVACGNACVNPQSDNANCGVCGKACTSPSVCANGACSTVCAAGFQKCGESCFDLQKDAGHCGSCDKVCDAGVPCYGGVCGCPDGVLFCQGQCFDPSSDAQHCGSCTTACSGGQACIDGKCGCAPGQTQCGTECSDLNSPQHCGSCAKTCATGEICAAGSCIPSSQACPNGLTRCGDSCVNLQTTGNACGSCDVKCAGGQACSAGKCGCPSGKTACGAGCVDLTSSALNCGSCGATCRAGQTCQASQCKCAEASDIVCDNACVDPKTDLNHCGNCTTKCSGGLPCTDGQCACPAGQMLCNGTCVSTDADAANCGACGTACPVGESCGGGKCTGPFGDSCKSTLATGISIDSISVYQAGKIPIMTAGNAVAKTDRPADIIQGKSGRIRVFTKLQSGWMNRTVSARLLLDNDGVKSNYFSKRNVTQDSAENSFATTFNFDVKAEDFTATTKYSVEIVECDGTAGGTMGTPRFPAMGDQDLGTRKTGVVKIHFVPLTANNRTASVDAARLDGYKAYMALMYPTTGVEYTVAASPLKVNQTISAQGDGWSETLDLIATLHESDNAPADTYYFGLFEPTDKISQYCGGGCVAGIGFVADTRTQGRHLRVSLGLSYGDAPSAQTFAHEIGHNHGRQHSPCGGAADPDPKYPYSGAKIGWWGYEAPEKLHNPSTDTDIMGYCNNIWVSDYVYKAWTDRVAADNGIQRELEPTSAPQHFLFLLTDYKGPRWGIDRPAPRHPSGDEVQADILDDAGNIVDSITVYRTPMDHLGGALYMVPDPQPGWHAIQVPGAAPLPFGASSFSQ